MAFFDRNNAKLPEELRDASQEDLLEAVKFYKENKSKMASTESELATTKQSLASMETQFNESKTRLSQLEAQVAEATKAKEPQPPRDQDKPVDFFEDPERAFNQRQNPRDMFMLNTASQVAQMGFEGGIIANPGKFGDDPKIYKKFQNEVVDLMRREPLVNQANPQAWKNAFLLIKGLHSDEIQDARKNQDVTFFGEQPKPAVLQETKPTDEVTDEDRTAASRYGITPEQVMASRRSLRIMPVEK